jgi:NADP-dependent 3-hydroxy acid dehydrogenase YdfG
MPVYACRKLGVTELANNERKEFCMAKTWFISLAGSGFSRQLAQLLLEGGNRVVAAVRKPDALQNLQRIIANG